MVIQGPLFREGHQGEIGDLLRRAITSIRKYLPDAEIVISTWLTENVDNVSFPRRWESIRMDPRFHGDDKDSLDSKYCFATATNLKNIIIVQSEKPAPFVECTGDLNNVNRQLLSTKRGIESATRPYVLKFRADHYLSGTEMMQTIVNTSASKYSFLSAPITITNFFIRNPLQFPALFHISDLIMFGKREDMLDFWQQPLVEEAKLFMTEKERASIIGNFQGPTIIRHLPEQSLLLGWLAKHELFINLPHRFFTTYALFILWEEILLANFNVLNHEKSGVVFPPRFLQNAKTIYSIKALSVIKRTIGKWQQKLRYMKLLLNKYIFIWFTFRSTMILCSHFFYALSPGLEKRVRGLYRKFLSFPRRRESIQNRFPPARE